MKTRIYPNYTNYYYYEEGNEFIKLIRKNGSRVIYNRIMDFNSSHEASEYFEQL